MTIWQIINSGKMEVCVPEIRKHSCVNVGFITKDGQEDETQLNIHSELNKNKGITELSKLFTSLCKELNTTRNSVIYIRVVASEYLEKLLIDKGY